MSRISAAQLASRIDHTLLKPETTAGDIDRLCEQAMVYDFWGVCLNLIWVPRASQRLAKANSQVKVVTVVAFPTGAIPTALKVAQTRWALDLGADEIDMVANIGALRSGEDELARDDIAAVAEVVGAVSKGKLLKVILETAVLSREHKIRGCELAAQAGADYVKTSTGTHPAGGATVEDVTLLAEHAGNMKVKAAGRIRDATTARAMLEAGAERIGTSRGPAIVDELK